MKISGKECDLKPLTVGELRAYLNGLVAQDPTIDTNLVHFLRMEGSEDDEGTSYVTHVDLGLLATCRTCDGTGRVALDDTGDTVACSDCRGGK